MKHDEIKEGCFYMHKHNYPIKVIHKEEKGIFSGIADILVERQMKDYSLNTHRCTYVSILYETRRTAWDVRSRAEEPAFFTLRVDFATPTNTAMYACEHCKEDEVRHKIEDVGAYRQCSGCDRKDGPWCNYGDD